jgi:iron complex outermembrane receptor protein
MVVAQREKEKREPAEEKEEVKRPVEIEEMVVTAQKREENVQDVPVSMSVFSDIQLEDAGIKDTLDLTRFIPNVYMQTTTVENILIIRGISSFDTSIYSPAGFYVDDVSFPLHYMHNAELFEVERAEILRGPQGTLYGRNNESGLINIITKQPDNELRGKVFGEYGNYNSYRFGGNISGPIVRDTLYLGLALQGNMSDGYVENEFNDDDKTADMEHKNGRATLRWTPAEKLDVSLIFDGMDTDDHVGIYRYLTGNFKTDRHKINQDADQYSEQKGNGETLRIKYEGDSFHVLSVSGLRYYKHDFESESDFTQFPMAKTVFTYKDKLLSQELRVSSPNNTGLFKWLGGAYVFKEEADIDYDRIAIPMMGPKHTVTDIDINGYAAFGQGTYTLFDRLHLTAGLRFDHQDLEGDLEDKTSNSRYDKKLDYNEVLPKLSIAYDLTDDIMAYTSACKGYLVGGYNYALSVDEESFYYDAEYTWNYEAGVKSVWLEKKLIANLAVFYIDIDDKQVFEVDSNTFATKVKNAARAHSQGVEIEFQARPMQCLDLFAGFGYTEAKFDDWTATQWNSTYTALEQYDYKDKYLPNAPKYTYNLGVQYRHVSGFFGRADLLGIGKIYGNAVNTVEEDPYELVNLRLGYEGEHFDLSLWCNNVFDKEYETIKYAWGPDELGVDGEPRMLGVTVTYRF